MPNRWEQIITSLYGQRFGFNHEGDLVVDGATVATLKRDTAGEVVGLLDVDGQSIIMPRVLAQSAIPFILPSSGTFTGGTGALSAITALPATYSGGCFMYFPAGAGLPQGAGWYWTVMSSTTAGTVYNNVYSSGDPKLASPGYATAGTAISSGATSYTQSTSEVTALQFTVPGGSMGPNGRIETWWNGQNNNSANNKIYAYKLGGSTLWTRTRTTSTYENPLIATWNMGGNTLQNTGDPAGPLTAQTSGNTQTTVNTALDSTLSLTLQLATATDFAMVAAVRTTLFYGA